MFLWEIWESYNCCEKNTKKNKFKDAKALSVPNAALFLRIFGKSLDRLGILLFPKWRGSIYWQYKSYVNMSYFQI